MSLLTHSRKRVFRECQRKHHLMYNEGLRSAFVAEALRFGTLWDDATSEWDRTGCDLEAAFRIVENAPPFDRAKARALLVGYHTRWVGGGYEVLAVQPEFRAPLFNPKTGRRSKLWQLGGKLDGVWRKDGRTLLVERKTTSEDIRQGSDYWKRLRLDGQVSDYYDGGKVLGYDIAGCLYDVTAKPGLKPLQANQRRAVAETPDEYEQRVLEDIAKDPNGYYGRAEVVRLEAELADARWDTWQLGKQIHAGARDGHAPKNPEACTRFGTCSFFSLCTGEADRTDSRFVILDNVHPELGSHA